MVSLLSPTSPDVASLPDVAELGLVAKHAKIGESGDREIVEIGCRVIEPDDLCPSCGASGKPRDTVVRRLAHEPVDGQPAMLMVRVRRYRCAGCGKVWRQDCTMAAGRRQKLSRAAVRWALVALVCDGQSMNFVAKALGVSWNTARDAVTAECREVLDDVPERFDGVRFVEVRQHWWSRNGRDGKYVTVFTDLTPVRDGVGQARLLGVVSGRPEAITERWLAQRPEEWRAAVDIIDTSRVLDAFTL